MSEITLKDALEGLDLVVDYYGPDHDYFDQTTDWEPGMECRLADEDGTPLCLIGVIAYDVWGFPVTEQHGVVPTPVKALLSYEAYQMLAHAQAVQDDGRTWGEARDSAYGMARYEGWIK